MEKLRIGIVFGGNSREREVSFAGGRTVYDNLNKDLFEAVPLFVDSFGNFVLLNWQYIYKGSIRDFYPAVEVLVNRTEAIPEAEKEAYNSFQVYAENFDNLTPAEHQTLLNALGTPIAPQNLKDYIDFAFLCLHGPNGEDGRIQGLFEYYNIPYSGSGILPSAIGINKAVQRKLLSNAGFTSPKFTTVTKAQWLANPQAVYTSVKDKVPFPLVVKASTQGSSIGVTILQRDDEAAFLAAVEKSFFSKTITQTQWQGLTENGRLALVRNLADIREGIGMPVLVNGEQINHPYTLYKYLNNALQSQTSVRVEAFDGESEIVVEGFIAGKEFSCIVVATPDGPIALPPTEIRKGHELFDYRSKYLPGLSRKITPIQVPDEHIVAITTQAEAMFSSLNFSVYARIDGFITTDGAVFLNDPNTTSGMMPSSFFFHQAAEIGLNPSQFLTFIISASLQQRATDMFNKLYPTQLYNRLLQLEQNAAQSQTAKQKVAVIFGGYSSERHISVESGRNIYEKLSSSAKYSPVPVFLTGANYNHEMYVIPINIMLKDNADDIKDKITHYHRHPQVEHIMQRCAGITKRFAGANALQAPYPITYTDLANKVNGCFIALHGRPGEDGQVQAELEKVGLPYNGSGQQSSATTIDKFKTNDILRNHGFNVAQHLLVYQTDWEANLEATINKVEQHIGYPLIAKPNDDGCSSAVKKIKTRDELIAYATLAFRGTNAMDATAVATLSIRDKEEFPAKNYFLVETLISKNNAKHFLEITGGMLTHAQPDGTITYEVFEASEALAGGEVLSLEEKFLAGEGQNITPARYSPNPAVRQQISDFVKEQLGAAAKVLNVTGYCRIDAFVRVFDDNRAEVIFIEVNSLPGMTPATAIFHQTAINGYKPYDFIDRILEFGKTQLLQRKNAINNFTV